MSIYYTIKQGTVHQTVREAAYHMVDTTNLYCLVSIFVSSVLFDSQRPGTLQQVLFGEDGAAYTDPRLFLTRLQSL